jgi:hypothetical protein
MLKLEMRNFRQKLLEDSEFQPYWSTVKSSLYRAMNRIIHISHKKLVCIGRRCERRRDIVCLFRCWVIFISKEEWHTNDYEYGTWGSRSDEYEELFLRWKSITLRKNKIPPSSGLRRKPSKEPALSRQQSELCLLGSKLSKLKSKCDLQQNILKFQKLQVK